MIFGLAANHLLGIMSGGLFILALIAAFVSYRKPEGPHRSVVISLWVGLLLFALGMFYVGMRDGT